MAIGNHLNASSRQYGDACGFKLESLKLLSTTKSVNNSITLLDYIVEYIDEVEPEISRFVEDFGSLQAVVRITQKDVELTVNTMEQKLNELSELLKKHKKKVFKNEDRFKSEMSDFLAAGEIHIHNLKNMVEQARLSTMELSRSFASDPKVSTFVWDEFFGILHGFTVQYEASRKRIAEVKVERMSRKRKDMVKYWSHSRSKQANPENMDQ